MRFIFVALIFYLASLIIQHYGLDSKTVFTGVYVVFVGALGSGASFAVMPSMAKA